MEAHSIGYSIIMVVFHVTPALSVCTYGPLGFVCACPSMCGDTACACLRRVFATYDNANVSSDKVLKHLDDILLRPGLLEVSSTRTVTFLEEKVKMTAERQTMSLTVLRFCACLLRHHVAVWPSLHLALKSFFFL